MNLAWRLEKLGRYEVEYCSVCGLKIFPRLSRNRGSFYGFNVQLQQDIASE